VMRIRSTSPATPLLPPAAAGSKVARSTISAGDAGPVDRECRRPLASGPTVGDGRSTPSSAPVPCWRRWAERRHDGRAAGHAPRPG
jgi:hypothetical protein